jgi:DNA-3-methyladenine glycosylase
VRPLVRAELPVETVALARFLLGTLVVRVLPEGVAAGRVVETEAYPPGDRAMHAYRRMTDRNRSLFLPHGHAYVYLCYGISQMLNVSSETDGVGAGVLFRAIEPVEGIALMMARRRTTRLLDLARGPGRLAQALEIDRRLNGVDLCAGGALHLATDGTVAGEIGESTRIGITKDADRVLRYFVRGSRYVSGPGALNRRNLE